MSGDKPDEQRKARWDSKSFLPEIGPVGMIPESFDDEQREFFKSLIITINALKEINDSMLGRNGNPAEIVPTAFDLARGFERGEGSPYNYIARGVKEIVEGQDNSR